jgi:hypothetical protein
VLDAEEFCVNSQKVGAWANIGSFIVGCVALYFMWRAQHPAADSRAVTPTNPIPPVMWIFLLSLILAGFLHLRAAYIQANQTAKPSNVNKVVVPLGQSEGRIFVSADVTSKFLIGLFEKHKTIDAKKLVEPFIGMWMQVSGSLSDVSELKSYGVIVHLKRASLVEATTALFFDQEWVDRLSILQKGSDITVIGQISDVDGLRVQLNHCELVSS